MAHTSILPDQAHQFLKFPCMIARASGHRGRNPYALANAAEVVLHEVKGQVEIAVLDLLCEALVRRVKHRTVIRLVRAHYPYIGRTG